MTSNTSVLLLFVDDVVDKGLFGSLLKWPWKIRTSLISRGWVIEFLEIDHWVAVLLKFWSFYSLCFCSFLLLFFDLLPWTQTLTSIHRLFSAFGPETECQSINLQSKSAGVLNGGVLILVVVNDASCRSRIVDFGSVSALRRDTTSGLCLNERWLCPTWDSLVRRRGPK